MGADWQMLIADFGLSKVFADDKQYFSTKNGVDVFLAPELRFGINAKFSYETDMYSLGLIFFYMLTFDKHLEYKGKSVQEQIFDRVEIKLEKDFNGLPVPDEVNQVLRGLL